MTYFNLNFVSLLSAIMGKTVVILAYLWFGGRTRSKIVI